jgi:ABC-type uncharacterized transport system auxiliary subunit
MLKWESVVAENARSNIRCRKLHNKELHNLYSSTSTVRLKKSRSIRWVGYVARIQKMILVQKFDQETSLGEATRETSSLE